MKTKKPDEMALAEKLRRCYQFERRFSQTRLDRDQNYRIPAYWRGSAGGGPERQRVTVWQKLENSCGRRQIDPIRYIQWCLELNQMLLDPPPEPNQLLAHRRMEAYETSKPSVFRSVQLWLLREGKELARRQFQMQKCDRKTLLDTWQMVLGDHKLRVSALYRYAMSKVLSFDDTGFDELVEFFEQHAFLQYHRHPDVYDEWQFRPCLGADFGERANRFYDYVRDHEP